MRLPPLYRNVSFKYTYFLKESVFNKYTFKHLMERLNLFKMINTFGILLDFTFNDCASDEQKHMFKLN